MENNEITVEVIEDILLEFLNITQEKFGDDGFPLDSKSKWLEFKGPTTTKNFEIKKIHNIFSKSEFISNDEHQKFNADLSKNLKIQQENLPKLFLKEFKTLLKNVNDNTLFYENLIFNQNRLENRAKTEVLDPLGYYRRLDLINKTELT